jgi:hypothetical protein
MNTVMTDEEFDLLDQLYFVQSFPELLQTTGLEEGALLEQLQQLFEKNWLRTVALLDGDTPPDNSAILTEGKQYFYVASKEGLLAHNLGV